MTMFYKISSLQTQSSQFKTQNLEMLKLKHCIHYISLAGCPTGIDSICTVWNTELGPGGQLDTAGIFISKGDEI